MGTRLRLIAMACLCLGCNQLEEDTARDVEIHSAGQSHAAEPAGQERKGKDDSAVADNDLGTIVEGGNQFALDLYNELRTEDSNLLFAPSSIWAALAMTCAGAAGETQAEFVRTLHVPGAPDALHDAMGLLRGSWTEIDGQQDIQLKMANRLWGRQGVEFLPKFREITRQDYGAECARLPFDRSEEARQAINSWVENQTERRITDLLSRGAVSADTRLVLTSAVYFNGRWARPFVKERTTNESFHLSAEKSVRVPMMRHQGPFPYAAVEDVQVLEMPYGDGRLSMVVLLPGVESRFDEWAAHLSGEELQAWMAALKTQPSVDVYLPRFTSMSRLELSRVLQTLGLRSAFDRSSANFAGMTGERDLWISTVVHNAFIDVDEKGTEAAAATAVIAEPTGAPPSAKIPVFRADRPFLFLIRDNQHGAILFLGQMVNPAAQSAGP